MKFDFCGQSYTYSSVNFDAQRAVNIFPVKTDTAIGGAQPMPNSSKSVYGMQLAPGKAPFSTLADTPIRGQHQVLGRAFAVAGYGLYEIFSNGTSILRGSLLTNTGNVSMDDNGIQLCIVDGSTTGGFVFTFATNVFAQITDPYFLGATSVTFIDGYFLFTKPNSGIYYLSALYNGLTGDPLLFATAEGSPDNLLFARSLHKEIWLFGTNTIEVVSNTGGLFPFTPNQGGFIEYGCAAPFSIAHMANTLFWLGNDPEGSGIVWMATGYTPVRISTFAVEFAIGQYGNISDAVGYTYQEEGHFFYVLNFTSANTTWVYDVSLGMWHERAAFSLISGFYERDRAQSHMYVFGKHLVGDYANGIIYQQSLSIYQDNGNPIRWMRTAPHIADDLEYIFYSRFQLDMQTGTGIASGASQDMSPQVMLKWSDDGAHTWSNEYWQDVGAIGQYKVRVIWRRLGRSRDRVFCVAGSTNTKTFLIAGHIDIEQGTN